MWQRNSSVGGGIRQAREENGGNKRRGIKGEKKRAAAGALLPGGSTALPGGRKEGILCGIVNLCCCLPRAWLREIFISIYLVINHETSSIMKEEEDRRGQRTSRNLHQGMARTRAGTRALGVHDGTS